MVSINPTLAISVAASGQDANFETRLNAMENAIFKLESTLENFISTNNSPGRSRGENDRGYLTDFSANAPQFEIDQPSDEERTVAHLLKRNPAAEYQIMYLMLQSRISQVRWAVQQMI